MRLLFRNKIPGLLLLVFFLSACSGIKTPDTLDPMILNVRQHFAPDQRMALFQVKASREQGKFVLHGVTTVPEARQALFDSLTARNIPVIDSIQVLPDTTVGEKPWGLVTLSVGNMRFKPDHGAEMASQLLMGTPVKILQYTHGWYRVQSPDNYIGWCESSVLAPLTETELDEWKNSDRYVFIQTGGVAYERADDQSPVVSDLVLGDLFTVLSEKKRFLQMQFPDGRTGFVRKSECQSYSLWENTEPEVNKVISTARLLMGSPYLWGGTSVKAVDCSGLIKTAYFSQGVILARDASQQARYGEALTVTDSLRFEPGDLLFFGTSKERITHVGMYIGDGQYIHASGLVRINSLNPEDPDYSEFNRKRLVSAGRVLNSLNTEEIVQVKEHEWYN